MNNPLIIVNPASGLGVDTNRTKTIEDLAHNLGWKGKIVETTKKDTADKIVARSLKKGVMHFIVCGGDGTVMEAVGHLVKKDANLSIVPLGTGNIFAHNLNIPMDTTQALKNALDGKAKKIDVGRVNNNYFCVNAGTGFDAEMMNKTKRSDKDKFGIFAYIFTGIKLLTLPRNTYKIKTDREIRETRARAIMIANMEKTAGGIIAAPGANPKSGTLKIGILKPKNIRGWLDIFLYAIFGKINKSNYYDLLEATRAEISLEKKAIFQCDGDVFPPTDKLIVDIFPSSLSVVL